MPPVRMMHVNHWLEFVGMPLDCEKLDAWLPNLESRRKREIIEKWDEEVYCSILVMESKARLRKREKRQEELEAIIEERFGTTPSQLTEEQLWELHPHTHPDVVEQRSRIAFLESELLEHEVLMRKHRPPARKEEEFAPTRHFEPEPKDNLSDSLFDS